MKKWIMNRISERTTWDGAALVALGVIVLIAKPIAGKGLYCQGPELDRLSPTY